jgi:hypothetical protein
MRRLGAGRGILKMDKIGVRIKKVDLYFNRFRFFVLLMNF